MKKSVFMVGILGLTFLVNSCKKQCSPVQNMDDTVDLQHITFADTARILDSIYAARKQLSSASACSRNLGWEIAVRLVIDSLEMEKTNSVLPKHMRYRKSNREKLEKEMKRFWDITYEYYEKLDSTDPWNSYNTNYDLLQKVILPHTREIRDSYECALEAYGPDGGSEE